MRPTSRRWRCTGSGMTEHLQGTEGVMSIVNLALLTGNIGKPGAGVNPLRGQNNVQGSAHMGCDPGILTARSRSKLAANCLKASGKRRCRPPRASTSSR